MNIVNFVAILLFGVCSYAYGFFNGRKSTNRVIFSDPKHPFKQADEEVFFVSGTSPEEAFKESKTVNDFISKIK